MKRINIAVWVSLQILTACAHQQQPVTAEAGPTAGVGAAAASEEPGLRLDVEPLDAELIVDGQSYGLVSGIMASGGVLPLKAGLYQVSLKRAGYATWRAEVSVGDKPEVVKVALLKR